MNTKHIKSTSKLLKLAGLFGFFLTMQPGSLWAATAINDSYVISNSAGTESLAVTYNDRFEASTPELLAQAGLISAGNLSNPAAGNLTLDTDDDQVYAVNFQPNAQFSGTVQFNYVLRDARGDSTASVTLTIVPTANEFRVIGDEFQSAGDEIIVYPLENDVLLAELEPTISVTQPDLGSLSEAGVEGAFLYTPPANITEATQTTASYTITYEGVGSDTGTITITIDPSLDPILNGIGDNDQRQLATVLQLACDINTASGAEDEQLSETCTELTNLANDVRSEALENILLRQIGAQSASLDDQVANQINLVSRRLRALREGASGISFNGLGVNLAGEYLALGDILDSYASGANAGDTATGGRAGAFITGTIEIGEGEARGKENDFDYDSQQLLLGSDYRFSSNLIMGLALGFDQTETKASGSNDTELEKDGVTLSLYGNYYPTANLYIDWLLGYGQSSIDTQRSIATGTINSASQGSTDGSHSSGALGVGYSRLIEGWSIDGYFNLDYRTVIIDAYEENNDAGLTLKVAETSTDTFTGHLGVRVSHAYSMDFGVMIPQFDFATVKEFRNESPLLKASLKELPEAGEFTLRNQQPDDSYFNAGLSLTTLFKNGFSGFVSYQRNFAKDDVSIQSWQAGARMEFGGPAEDIRLFKSRDDQGVGLGAFAGTTGLGVALTLPVHNEYLSVRGILTSLDYDTDDNLDDIDYDINLDLRTAGALLDWHPFGGGFRISGGFFALKNDIEGRATPTEEVEIGDSTFTPEQVGTLTADVGYDNSFSPYLGVGWGNAVAPGSNWSVSADIGILFTDNPTAELSADSPLAEINPGLKAELLRELEKEEESINNDDLADIEYWPLISLGVSLQF